MKRSGAPAGGSSTMVTIGEATADERKEAMRAAVDYNLPCDLRIEQGGYPVHLKSRFLALQPGPGEYHVLVEAPIQDGVIVPVHPDDEAEVFFRVDGTRYTYRTIVVERTTFTLSSGDVARAVATTYPRLMIRGQRREYYRIRPTPEAPIPLRIGLLPRQGEVTPHAVSFTTTTEVANISAGGLAFELWEEYHRNLRLHDRLLCDLTMPPGELLTLQGRVASVSYLRGHRVIRFGITFTGLDQSRDLRIAQDRLLRYIVHVQREELARRARLQ